MLKIQLVYSNKLHFKMKILLCFLPPCALCELVPSMSDNCHLVQVCLVNYLQLPVYLHLHLHLCI